MQFDHVNIRTSNLDAMRDFLCRVAEIEMGERPNFSFPGYWLYAGDKAVIHLISHSGDPADLGAGSVDHIAFGTFDFDTKKAALEADGLAFRVSEVPGRPLRQIFVEGPDGVTLELQCPSAA